MWMSRHGQQLAAALIFLLFLSSHCLALLLRFSPGNPIGGLTLLLRGAQMHIFFDCSARFQTSLRVCHKYAHYACSIWIIHANLGLRAYKCDKHVLVVCAKHKGQ